MKTSSNKRLSTVPAATPTTAVLLAAGLGLRLRGQSSLPKGLLEFGGMTLVERSLNTLFACGITRVLLVTGYEAAAYQARLEGRFPGLEQVYNAGFASTGSMHSLYTVRNRVSGDFLLLESDLLYEPRGLQALLTAGPGNHLLLSGTTGHGDEVYAYRGGQGLLSLLSKKLQPDLVPYGEFTGISRISPEFYAALCRHYEQHPFFGANCHYDDCISELSATWPVQLQRVEDLLWTEVDDPSQFERARKHIAPALNQSRSL